MMDPMQAIWKKLFKEALNEVLPEAIQNALNKEMQKNAPQKSAPKTEYLSRAETAELLSVSLTTIDKWAYKQGVITAYRINSRVRFKRFEVEACLNKVKVWKHNREGGGDMI